MNGSIEILAIYEQILDKLIPSNKRGEQIKSQLKYSDIIHVIQNCTKQKKTCIIQLSQLQETRQRHVQF